MRAAFYDLEPELTDHEKESYPRYEKLWGAKWVEDALNSVRSRQWIDTYLDREVIERKTPFNCYNTGLDRYTRKDGQLLTFDDIEAVKFLDFGQCNVFTVSDNQMSIQHRWECDSSG